MRSFLIKSYSLFVIGSIFCMNGYASPANQTNPKAPERTIEQRDKVSKPENKKPLRDNPVKKDTIKPVRGVIVKKDSNGKVTEAQVKNSSFELGLTENSKGGWDLDSSIAAMPGVTGKEHLTGSLLQTSPGNFVFNGRVARDSLNISGKVLPIGVRITDANGVTSTFSDDQLEKFCTAGFSGLRLTQLTPPANENTAETMQVRAILASPADITVIAVAIYTVFRG